VRLHLHNERYIVMDLNSISQFFKENFITMVITSLGPIVSFFITTNINKSAQIQINEKAEKIKHDLQCKYLQEEIKIKNLLGIYSRLYQLIRENGNLIVLFDAVNKKTINLQPNLIKGLIKSYFIEYKQIDLSSELKNILAIVEHSESSFLFISSSVQRMIQDLKKLHLQLYSLVKDEIINNKFQSYTEEQCFDLLNRANLIIKNIVDNKNRVKEQMHQELNMSQ